MHGRRLGAALTALALLFTVVVGIAGAGDLTPGPLVQVSGTSPFLGCTADAVGTQSGTVYVNSEVEPWIDVNRANTSNVVGIFQQDRWSNGGARGLVAGVSLNGGASFTLVPIPKVTVCSGGTAANGGNYQRATDPWVTFGPNGNLYQLSLSFNDVSPPFTTEDFDHALLASRSTNGGLTWSDPVVVEKRHGAKCLQRQAVDHGRPDERRPCLRGLGPARLPAGEAAQRRRVVPFERVQGSDLVRPEHERRPVVGARARDLRPGPERPDDRQPDRRAAERHARGHSHRVQQREHGQAPRRHSARASLYGQRSRAGPARSSSTGSARSRSPTPRPVLPSARARSSRTSGSTGRTGGCTPLGRTRASAVARTTASRSHSPSTVGSRGRRRSRSTRRRPGSRQGTSRRSPRPSRLRTTARSESRTTTSATTRQIRAACPPTTSPSIATRRRRPHARAPSTGGTRTGSPTHPSTCSMRPSRAASSRATMRVSRRRATSSPSSRSRTAAIRRAPSSGASGRSSSVAGRFGAPPPKPVAPLEELPPDG